MAFNPNNPHNHPFWDFVAGLDAVQNQVRYQQDQATETELESSGQEQAQEKGKYRAPSVEDEKMGATDPEARPAKGDLADEEKGRCGNHSRHRGHRRDDSSSSDEQDRRRHRCRGPGGMHHRGPPPFGPWGFGPFGPNPGADFFGRSSSHRRGPHHHGPPPPPHTAGGPPPPPGPFGAGRPPFPPPPPGSFGAGHPPFPPPPGSFEAGHPPFPPPHMAGCPPPPPPGGPEFGPHHHHGRRGPGGPFGRRGGSFGGRGPCGRRGPGREFKLPKFLTEGNNPLSMFLNSTAKDLGFDLSRGFASGNSDADFVPPYDLFDLTDEYLIHVSLPGAQKDDIGLEFDGEHHTLRVSGVIYRPGIDETLTSALVQSGRDSEVGVFESKVRLPSHDNETIEINFSAISAKLRDGVLVIHVPKVQKKKEELKRNIRIDTPSPSPEEREKSTHQNNLAVREKEQPKDLNAANPFATNHKDETEMYFSSPVPVRSPGTEKGDDITSKDKEAAEVEDLLMRDDDPPEQLPRYSPSDPVNEDGDNVESDAEEEEGEYVKISVD